MKAVKAKLIIYGIIFGSCLLGGLFGVAYVQELTSTLFGANEPKTETNLSASQLSEEVLKLKPKFQAAMNEVGMPLEHIDVVLAVCMQESKGKVPDVMQCSESLGLPPNTLGLDASIKQGVKYLWEQMKAVGVDLVKQEDYLKTAVQSYNYGGGFTVFAKRNGMKFSPQLAEQFSASKGGSYGDKEYVAHVWRYLKSSDGESGNHLPMGDGTFKQIMAEAIKYQGWSYAWGGANPQSGFDCSGLTQWSYNVAGKKIGRVTTEQWADTEPVSTPKHGDLIFFKGTYGAPDYISHVGIYVDSQTMYDSNSSGIGYHTWNSGYWKEHFAGIRRVK